MGFESQIIFSCVEKLIFTFGWKKKELRHFKKMESSAGFSFAFLPVQATKKQAFFAGKSQQPQSETKKCKSCCRKTLCFLREKKTWPSSRHLFFFFRSSMRISVGEKTNQNKPLFRNASFLFLVQKLNENFCCRKSKEKETNKKRSSTS